MFIVTYYITEDLRKRMLFVKDSVLKKEQVKSLNLPLTSRSKKVSEDAASLLKKYPLNEILRFDQDVINLDLTRNIFFPNELPEGRKLSDADKNTFIDNLEFDNLIIDCLTFENALEFYLQEYNKFTENTMKKHMQFEKEFIGKKDDIEIFNAKDRNQGYSDCITFKFPEEIECIESYTQLVSRRTDYKGFSVHEIKANIDLSEELMAIINELNDKALILARKEIACREEKRNAEIQEKKRKVKEKESWIEQKGSNSLKLTLKKGFECTLNYEKERILSEFPEFQFCENLTEKHFRERANPSARAITELDKLEKKYPNFDIKLAWIKNFPSTYPSEEVIIVQPEWCRKLLIHKIKN